MPQKRWTSGLISAFHTKSSGREKTWQVAANHSESVITDSIPFNSVKICMIIATTAIIAVICTWNYWWNWLEPLARCSYMNSGGKKSWLNTCLKSMRNGCETIIKRYSFTHIIIDLEENLAADIKYRSKGEISSQKFLKVAYVNTDRNLVCGKVWL